MLGLQRCIWLSGCSLGHMMMAYDKQTLMCEWRREVYTHVELNICYMYFICWHILRYPAEQEQSGTVLFSRHFPGMVRRCDDSTDALRVSYDEKACERVFFHMCTRRVDVIYIIVRCIIRCSQLACDLYIFMIVCPPISQHHCRHQTTALCDLRHTYG